ncbi:MAG TPA: ExbD/TolR family protein [Candidatus Polarisedimenticolaceae bacterium]|nr:ExbD/TolR family protein [Candidatus Polarisedimenticolaceae bacterium]
MAAPVIAASSGRRRPPLAEINVTPLVDVMLVLLIISMVAAPMLQEGIPLELPKSDSASPIEDTDVVVSVDRDGRIRINEQPVHPDLLGDRMQALARSRPDETVFLRGDRLLPYGEVLLVMDRIRKAGITKVALVTVPMTEEDRPR